MQTIKFIIISFVLYNYSTASAQVSTKHVYKILGKNITVYANEEVRVIASVECKMTRDKKECSNLPQLNKIDPPTGDRTPAGNPDEGALICEDQLGGKSVMGYDADENEISFCHFSDKDLFISNGTISYHASKSSGYEFKSSKSRTINRR